MVGQGIAVPAFIESHLPLGMLARSRLFRAIAFGGAAILAVSAFLPWFRIGARERNTFELAGALKRLGVDGWPGTALRLWPLMPLLLAIGVALVLLGYRRLGAAAGIAMALLGGVAAAGALQIPDQPLTGPGTAIAGALLAFLGNALLLRRSSPRLEERT